MKAVNYIVAFAAAERCAIISVVNVIASRAAVNVIHITVIENRIRAVTAAKRVAVI